jgi:hypothetical protein
MDYKKLNEKWDKWFNSDEGKASLEDFANNFIRKKKITAARVERVKEYVEKHGMLKIMERLINEHDETWREHCYLNGHEPNENNKLGLMIDFVLAYGKPTQKHTNKFFTNQTWQYGDFYFNLMHGQGSVWSIYYKNECIY